jgi:hypothetical protein
MNVARSWQELSEKGSAEALHPHSRSWPFAAIRAPRGGMPQQLRAETRGVLIAPGNLHLAFAKARYVTAPDDTGLWAVPGAGVLCLVRAVKVAASCAGELAAYREGLLLETYKTAVPGGRPTSFTALGIVPNGVRFVHARISGVQRRIPVVHNAYALTASVPVNVIPLNRNTDGYSR